MLLCCSRRVGPSQPSALALTVSLPPWPLCLWPFTSVYRDRPLSHWRLSVPPLSHARLCRLARPLRTWDMPRGPCSSCWVMSTFSVDAVGRARESKPGAEASSAASTSSSVSMTMSRWRPPPPSTVRWRPKGLRRTLRRCAGGKGRRSVGGDGEDDRIKGVKVVREEECKKRLEENGRSSADDARSGTCDAVTQTSREREEAEE